MNYKYIVIEWIHGSWKSSVAHGIVDQLRQQWVDAEYFHMPDETDDFGKLIRKTLTEQDVYQHRQVMGLLYAAFANRFHYMHDHDEKVYVLDRHAVTTWLVFQRDIADHVRQEIYGPGISQLQQRWVVLYVSTSLNVAAQRTESRNQQLQHENENWKKHKANDLFIKEKYVELADLYDKTLVQKIGQYGIPAHVISNDGMLDDTLAAALACLH